jgi:hypothetical protein
MMSANEMSHRRFKIRHPNPAIPAGFEVSGHFGGSLGGKLAIGGAYKVAVRNMSNRPVEILLQHSLPRIHTSQTGKGSR